MHDLQRLTEAGEMKGSSKDRVPHDQVTDGLLKASLLQRGLDLETEDIMVNGRSGVQFSMEEHSQLQAGERIGVFGVGGQTFSIVLMDQTEWRKRSRSDLRGGLGGELGEGSDRWMLKKLFERELKVMVLRGADDPDAADGIAAQFEVIVIHPHFVELQDFAPDFGQSRFNRGSGRDEFCADGGTSS